MAQHITWCCSVKLIVREERSVLGAKLLLWLYTSILNFLNPGLVSRAKWSAICWKEAKLNKFVELRTLVARTALTRLAALALPYFFHFLALFIFPNSLSRSCPCLLPISEHTHTQSSKTNNINPLYEAKSEMKGNSAFIFMIWKTEPFEPTTG